jgi:hypothetical protein
VIIREVRPETIINVDDNTATHSNSTLAIDFEDTSINKEVRPKIVVNVYGSTATRPNSTPHCIQPDKAVTSFHMALQIITHEIVRSSINIPIQTVLEHVQHDDTGLTTTSP